MQSSREMKKGWLVTGPWMKAAEQPLAIPVQTEMMERSITPPGMMEAAAQHLPHN